MLRVLTPAPTPTPTPTLAPLLELAAVSNLTAPLMISNLRKVFTVKDVWHEWKESLGGQPVI